MSQFGEFDVPDSQKYEEVKPEDKDKESDKPSAKTRSSSQSKPKPRRSGGSSFNFAKFFSFIFQPLVTLAGAWYIYNWFFIDGKTFESEGSLLVIAAAVLVGLNLIGFVGRLAGTLFKYVRGLASVALLGYVIYMILQQSGIIN